MQLPKAGPSTETDVFRSLNFDTQPARAFMRLKSPEIRRLVHQQSRPAAATIVTKNRSLQDLALGGLKAHQDICCYCKSGRLKYQGEVNRIRRCSPWPLPQGPTRTDPRYEC